MYDPTFRENLYSLNEILKKFDAIRNIRTVKFSEFILLHCPPTTNVAMSMLYLDIDINKNVSVMDHSIMRRNNSAEIYLLFINMQRITDELHSNGELHSNVVFIDLKTYTADRFDGHGSDPENSFHPISFRSFYNAANIDAVIERFITTELRLPIKYYPPPEQYPVMCQSYSRNDSVFNSAPYPNHFKQDLNPGVAGDSFCQAWISYYILLRMYNTDRDVVYTHMNQGTSILAKGRHSADIISNYIRYIYDKTLALRVDPDVQALIYEISKSLQSQILVPHSVAIVQENILHSLYEKNLGVTFIGGNRDETLVMDTGEVFNIDISKRLQTKRLQTMARSKWIDHNFMESTIGSSMGGNTKLSSIFKTSPEAYLKKGNILVFGKDVFVGRETETIYNMISERTFTDYFQISFPGNTLSIVPQFMWHLDRFALLVAPNIIMLPILPSTLLSKTVNSDETKNRFLKNLLPYEYELLDAEKIFKNKGLRVAFMDGYFFENDVLVASYFSGLTGLDIHNEPYLLIPKFADKYNRLFLLELRLLNISINVHFIGNVDDNITELNKFRYLS
jgi:hypothetical protein